MRAWPDGAVVQPYRLNEASDVYFVPIRNNALDFSTKLQLTDDKSVWSGSRQFARSRHLLLWLGNPDRELNSESISLYNLKTQEKQVFPFRERDVRLREFDGTIAVIQHWNDFIVFDTVRRERLGVTRFEDALAEKDGFRYYIFKDQIRVEPGDLLRDRYSVISVDLTSLEHATQVLHEFVLISGSPQPKVVERGIEVWNGKKMLLLLWAQREGQ